MSLSFSHARVTIPHRVITRAVEGTTVLLDATTGRTFTLDDVGTRALAVLTSSASVQHAYEALLAEYRVEPDELRKDLEALIESLSSRNLLEVAHG